MIEMKTKRHNWSSVEDEILAEIVLNHKKKGKKMKDAWEEAETKIGRSPGACKIRWIKVLSSQYEEEKISEGPTNSEMSFILLSSSRKKSPPPPVTTGIQQEMNFDDYTIGDTKNNAPISESSLFQSFYQFLGEMEIKYGHLYEQMKSLSEENERLKIELDEERRKLSHYDDIKDLIKEFNQMS